MPESSPFTIRQVHSTAFISAAAERVMKNATLAIGGGAGSGAAAKAALESINVDLGEIMMGRIAIAMYKAACLELVSAGLEYPPLKPHDFLRLEDLHEGIKAAG